MGSSTASEIGKDIPVAPVLHRAAMTRILPEPTGEEAESYAERILKGWGRTKDLYREEAVSLSGAKELDFDGTPAIIPMKALERIDVYFPALEGQVAGGGFNTQLRTEIKLAGKEEGITTKNWSLVGTAYRIFGDRVAIQKPTRSADIAQTIKLYRDIAEASIAYSMNQMRSAKKAVSGGRRRLYRRGELEIAVLGIRDERLKAYMEFLSNNDDVKMRELLEDSDADGIFSAYLNPVLGTRGSIRNRTKREGIDWYQTPTIIEAMDDDNDTRLMNRNVFYLMRESGDGTLQAAGIGYDDSVNNDLAARSSIRITNYVGSKI